MVVGEKIWQVIVQMELLKGANSVFWHDVFLILLVANVVGYVREQVDECIGDEADQVHCLFLRSHIERQQNFSNNVI